MKLKFICVGKTSKPFLVEGENEYLSRLRHYVSLERIEISDVRKTKNTTSEQLKLAEGSEILKRLNTNDYVVLLDERGKNFSSISFAAFLEQHKHHSIKTLVFVVGGAFGFSEGIYQRANMTLSLSSMTYSHQMVRMIFLEQLYRACTIIRGEGYHHE